MGKLHTKKEFVRKGAHFRKVASHVDVARLNPPMFARPQDRKHYGPFVACVKIGGGPILNTMCAAGKNPRKALAAALRKVAKQTSTRSGAYAGYRRR